MTTPAQQLGEQIATIEAKLAKLSAAANSDAQRVDSLMSITSAMHTRLQDIATEQATHADIIYDLLGPAEPKPEPDPPVAPTPAPTPDYPIAHTIDLADGEQTLNIPRDVRSPDQWVVVRGSRKAVITGLNDISTPSLVRFEGVTIKTKVQGRDGGEFTFVNCAFDVADSVCWGVSKATVIGCDITSQSNVFAGGVWHYVARDNTIDYYREDLWRGGTGELIDTIIVKHERVENDHPDVFEIARGKGFNNLVIRNLSGPGGEPAQIHESQGIAGGDIRNAVFENIKLHFVQTSGIHAVQVGGKWENVSFKGVVLTGSGMRTGDDYQPINVSVEDSPGLEVRR